MKRLECLDGLRGVLAVYVMIGHMAPFAASPDAVVRPLSHGGAAVDVFFMLSGLVIMRSLQACDYAARPFLIARFARIFPVFLVMFLAGVAVQPLPVPFGAMPWIGPESPAHGIWSTGWPLSWPLDVMAHLTMTHGLFPNAVAPFMWVSFLGAAWSLSTEWQFYILALCLGRTRMGAGWLVVCLFCVALAGLIWDMAAPEAWHFSRAFLPNKAAYFALGIASGIWVDSRRFVGFMLALAATLGMSVAHGRWEALLPPLFWTLCLAAQLYPRGLAPVAFVLRSRPVRYLGAISFPIYLANEPIQKILGIFLSGLARGDGRVFTALWVPLALLFPAGAAVLLHRFVERPGIRWGRIQACLTPVPDARCALTTGETDGNRTRAHDGRRGLLGHSGP